MEIDNLNDISATRSFFAAIFSLTFLDKIGSFLDPFPQLSPNRQT